MVQEKSQAGWVEITTAHSGAWPTWALVLCQAQSPHLLNGSGGIHLMKSRKDGHSGLPRSNSWQLYELKQVT